MLRPPPRSTPFPTRRSSDLVDDIPRLIEHEVDLHVLRRDSAHGRQRPAHAPNDVERGGIRAFGHRNVDRPLPIDMRVAEDRKSTRLNSSHMSISYAVFCLKK